VARFPGGDLYPHEEFIQNALVRHFVERGFSVEMERHNPDVLAWQPGGERWHIEAKGLTTAVGLDFRTGIGQLVQGMTERGPRYAIAVPDEPAFRSQCSRVTRWVRQDLNLWWLFVDSQGSIRATSPDN
jgi:hypothetical protein